MRALLKPLLVAVALPSALWVPLSAASCNGTSPASGASSSSGSGAASSSASSTGGGGATTTTGVFVGSSGGTTGTCGGPPPSDAGDDGPTGCEDLDGGAAFDAVAPILLGCFGETCHNPDWDQPSLVNVPAYECCDGRLLVAPGNPNKSYVIDKLTGQNLCQGGRMPLNGPPYLTDEEVLVVRQWICAGAPP